jgi:hypothetical protein
MIKFLKNVFSFPTSSSTLALGFLSLILLDEHSPPIPPFFYVSSLSPPPPSLPLPSRPAGRIIKYLSLTTKSYTFNSYTVLYINEILLPP